MTAATISQASAIDLPDALRRAQEAIHFPEVQEMLRRLSEYQLGIFMPHMHDEKTGEFKVLPRRSHAGGIGFGSDLQTNGRNCKPGRSFSACGLDMACWGIDACISLRNGLG